MVNVPETRAREGRPLGRPSSFEESLSRPRRQLTRCGD